MSNVARLELLAALRYVMIDLLDSNRGRWVKAIIFLATWGSLALWFLLWGAFFTGAGVRRRKTAARVLCWLP